MTPEESGTRLIDFIKVRLMNVSAKQIKRTIEQKGCQVNGRTERFASMILGRGDRIAFAEVAASPADIKEELRILHEDSAFLFYDKPSGIASDDPNLLKTLRTRHPKLELVHRLDKETSGVLLFAKSHAYFEKMVQLFKDKLVDKEYLALVDGVPHKKQGKIDNFLGKIATYQGQTLWGEVESGLPAQTKWLVEKEGTQGSLLRCIPITGRTHQLRVHLNGMGHPILGDSQYGRRFRCSFKPRRCLLHAQKLSFNHPDTGSRLEIEAPLPEDFLEGMRHILGVIS
ncbi:MAG: RluA family pseudouridine synthase [Parachlamydia sp.]|nr:RluA family pseudouridine synthase [Parachlamydia sp.]